MNTEVLSRLGFSDPEVRTYLFVLENGEQTAGTLAQRLGFPRASLYGFLEKLSKSGLIIESMKNGVKIFTAAPAEKITLMFDQKIDDWKNEKKKFEEILPNLKKGIGNTLAPKFQLFEGKDGIQNAYKDAYLYSNLETETYWPMQAMIDILGPSFLRYFNKERIKRNIHVRAIWPQNQLVSIKKHPYLAAGEDFLRETRVAPKEIDFDMGYWIYGNKVMFISSRKESFAFIIESAEFAVMTKSQFDNIWKVSKPFLSNRKDANPFLKEINA